MFFLQYIFLSFFFFLFLLDRRSKQCSKRVRTGEHLINGVNTIIRLNLNLLVNCNSARANILCVQASLFPRRYTLEQPGIRASLPELSQSTENVIIVSFLYYFISYSLSQNCLLAYLVSLVLPRCLSSLQQLSILSLRHMPHDYSLTSAPLSCITLVRSPLFISSFIFFA